MRAEQQLHARCRNGLDCHYSFRFLTFFIGIGIHLAHVETEQNCSRCRCDSILGAFNLRLYFCGGKTVSCQIALEIHSHRIREFFFDSLCGDNNKTPRLAVVRGGRKRRGGEHVLDTGIRYRIGFEPANGASSPQKGMKISCSEGQSGEV